MIRMVQHVFAEVALFAVGAALGVVALNVAVLAAGDIFRRTGLDVVGAAERVIVVAIGIAHGRLPALEAAGLTPVETDLGEWIIQLAGERPSHILAPVIHRSRGQIAEVLALHSGGPMADDPVGLVT